ncbi:tape measure protein [Acinetobacter sp. YH12086]|uniref:tape measure protein n=1 Tax=Acinetobacter sp. YH12086 TaxID=2601078 RepID=UPI0015D2A66C|nr:tape measure protein [Acinetobacter sp. YH12086]
MATKLGTLTLDLIAKTAGFTEPMKKAGDTAERESKRIENSAGSAIEMIKGLGVTALAGFTVGSVISMADEYTQMAAQIRNATSSQQEYNKVQQHLLETANTTYRPLKEAQQVYLDIGGALKAYGETTDRSLRITDSLSFSFTHNATAADKAASATDAYMKSIYSGKVSGDAWISILSAIPSIVTDLSKSLNKSEADILSMGNAGKLSTKDLNNALDASREKSEALANNMSNSLRDGLNNAHNGFTVLAGKINETYGVTNAMAGSLGVVGEAAKLAANNLDALGNVTMVAGAYLAGSYLPFIYKQALAIKGKTLAVIENIRAEQLANEITAQRTARVAHLTLAELKNAEAQYARMSGMARLAYFEKTILPLRAANTAALEADTVAQNANNASKSLAVRAGSSLKGILGGPVGLGLTVATVAAGYLLMKDNADKATASIDTQGKSVGELVVKYRELNTLQRDNEAKALADQIEELGLKYRVASSDLYSFMQALPVSDEKIATFSKLNSALSQGRITSDEYYKAVKNVNILTDDQLSKVRKLLGGYVDAKSKFKDAESAQNAFKTALNGVTGEVKKQASEVAVLSEELKKLLEDNSVVAYKNNLVGSIVSNAKVDPKLAEYIYEMRKAAGILGTGKSLTEDQLKSVRERWQSEKNLNKTIDERNKLEEKNKKLVEAQGNAMKVNALVASNAAKYNFKGIEAKNGLPSGLLSAVHMQESRGNSNAYNKSTGASGGFQFLSATAKQYGVSDRFNLAQSAEGAGKYLKHLLSLFNGDIEKAISAYHAGEGNVQRGTNIGPINRQYVKNVKGYMGGASGVSFTEDYSFDDWVKEQEKIIVERERIAEKQKQLNADVADDATRIRQQLADKFEEIDQAGFSDAKASELKAQYQKRADIEIQIASAAQADKLATYSDYMKSEEQLVNESYARRQRDLKLDIQLTADQYAEASLHLEKQRAAEIEKIRIAQSKQLLEAKRHWISAADYAKEYYALVREEILNTAEYSPEMKQSLVKEANFNQGLESNAEREQVWGDYKSMMGLDKSPYQEDMDLLAEARKHMLLTEEEYQQQRLAMQMSYGAQYGADFAGMMMGLVDSCSSAYAVLGGIQKGAALFSTALNSYQAISAAWASAPFPYNMPAITMATIETGLLQAAVSALSPVGYATGGHITGKGTGTSDEIPIMASNGEFMMRTAAVNMLGLDTLNFMNQTGRLPNAYADGGSIALDAPKLLNPQQNKDLTNYLSQAQNSSGQSQVNLNPNFVIVDERESLSDYLFSPDGTKAFVKFFKRNRSALGV